MAFSNGQESVSGISIPIWLMLCAALSWAPEPASEAKKIIKSVGMDMVKLEKYQGFSADLAAAFCLLYSSLWGISGIHNPYQDNGYYGCWCSQNASLQLT